MSNNNNRMIVFASILGAILATGLLALNPSMVGNADAQLYGDQYGYDNNPKKSSHTDIQKIKCVNSNINVNGVDVSQIPQDGTATAESANEGTNAANTENGNGLGDRINVERNLVNVCANVNANEQTIVPPPTTATLTVNKEVFGCNIDLSEDIEMDCEELENNDPRWLPCTDPEISSSVCQHVPANLFDIEVLDDQNNQIIPQFEGSTEGTTIENLQPGTYTVNEIKHESTSNNELRINADYQQGCINAGFVDGGQIKLRDGRPENINLQICIEYEDEQGNNCSTVAHSAGEENTCTVKNYIRFADSD